MKKSILLFCGFTIAASVFLGLAAVSCSNNDGELIAEANEKAAGYYQYLSITWKGPAIDLNGDGILNSDILKEYEGASECERILKSKKAGIVYPLDGFSRQQTILIDCPKQSLFCFNKEKLEWMSGELGKGAPFSFSPNYTYERPGYFKFNCSNAVHPSGWGGYGYEAVDSFSNLEILSISNGVLAFKVDYTLYDFATKSKVTAPLYAVMLRTMKRVRY